MAELTPTFRQRVIASDWLQCLWMLTFALGITLWTVRSIGPVQHAFGNAWSTFLFMAVLLMSAMLGFVLSVPTAWVLMGPTLMDQGKRNGGPFKPGDLVQVISGPYRNRVARVYSTWQCETVRVDLGEEAKQQFKDIFAAYQLLCVERSEATDV
jgi:hypothetical protein